MNNIKLIDTHIHGSFGINFNYANYDEINYECSLLGFTNMDRKDGEEFSYYIPSFVSDTNTICFNLSNLTYSHWKRKSEIVVRV